MDESINYSIEEEEEGGVNAVQGLYNTDGRRQGGSSLQAIVGINIGQVFRL